MLDYSVQEKIQRFKNELAELDVTSINQDLFKLEQFLTGLAYLAVKLENKITADLPEIIQPLLQQYFPLALQPIPLMIIAKIEGIYNYNFKLKKKSVIFADYKYNLQTAACHNYLPLTCNAFNLKQIGSYEYVYDINLQLFSEINISNNLMLFLDAPLQLLYQIRSSFLNNKKIILELILSNGEKKYFDNAVSINPAFCNIDDLLLPAVNKQFIGLQQIVEYFAYPDKFRFLRLNFINNIELSQLQVKNINIKLEFACTNFSIAAHQLKENFLQFNCLPLLNLAEQDAEPIKIKQLITDYNIKTNCSIYELKHLIGYTNNGQTQELIIDKDYTYQILDNKHFISLKNELDNKLDSISPELLVTDGTVTNNYNWLQAKLYCDDLPDSINLKSLGYINITVEPDFKNGLSLVNNLSCSIQTITNAASLKKMFELYNFTKLSRQLYMCDSIIKLEQKLECYMSKGVFTERIAFDIELLSNNFSDNAEAELFAYQIHQFLISLNDLNNIITTNFLLLPKKEQLSWTT